MAEPKPRVLFVSYTADWTGPTNSLLLLLSFLRQNFDVQVLVPEAGRFTDMLDDEGIRFFSLRSLTKWSLPRVFRLLRSERIDLVYANTTHSSSRVVWLAARLTGTPFINHVRAMCWGASNARFNYLRSADAVIAVSRACADSISRFVDANRLHVVHNGVSEEPAANNTERTTLPTGSPLVVSVSHVCERKGQLFTVEAFARLVSRHPNARLCLVGSTDREPAYVQTLIERIESLGVTEAVDILGFRTDTQDILEQADLFIHAALNDPHPRSVVEAMNAGLPVVAFATDGVAETVVPGETGLLVQKGDVDELGRVLLELADNKTMRSSLGSAGKQHVLSRFTAEATARQVARIIDDVLAARSAKAGVA